MQMKIPFFNNKKQQLKEASRYPSDNIPNHVAIIMDGNGRWAKQHGMPRFYGHKEGVTTVAKIVEVAVKCNIKVLTLYAFSTENWKRPKLEVDYILRLPKEFLHIYLPDLIDNNVRIQAIGDMENLPSLTRDALQYGIEQTKNNDGLQLNFALNYGSRNEIVHAMKKMLVDIKDDKLSIDDLDEDCFSQYLYTANVPEPDLLIRTGGEKRLSNFLLWQMAYTEFWFTDVLWPDFAEETFLQALEEYGQRKRRFGGI